MKVGVLALQGAFLEHEVMLQRCGAACAQLRQREDLQGIDALVLPGGESTVQGKLLRELDMLEPLRARILDGMPVLATCAGMILLSQEIAGGEAPHLATMPIRVRRNAYGRQLGSFETTAALKGIGDFRMTFIRAPYVEAVGPGVEVLSEVDGRVVAVRFGNQLALAFHPEMGTDDRVHRAFLAMRS